MNKVIKLYTDGGCRGNQSDNNIGAWGAYMVYGDVSKEIKGGEINTTNNIMELKGCIEGLKAIKNKTLPVEVYLDSAYVLNGITNWIEGWKKKGWRTANKKPVLNKELWIELDSERNKFNNIEFIKVKGHAGNEGNEIADRLCNEAMDEIE
jgi:ribonuclease HI|nr:MAG TPA: ribonuclease HI [Caudoviricetes sp.]